MRHHLAVFLTAAVLLAACAPATATPVPVTSTSAASSSAAVSAASSETQTTVSSFGVISSTGAVTPGGMTGIKPSAAASQGTLPGVDMMGYRNDKVGFSISFPLVWQTEDETANPVVYSVAVTPGTTLLEKRFEILTTENASECKETTYQRAPASAPEHVTINGIDFLKETGNGVAAGNVYDWTAYSVMKNGTCITITFLLHSASSGVYATEPPAYDKAEESQIFEPVINSFKFD